MILYLSSQKFGNDFTYLKNWIKEHSNKILLIFNALDAKGEDKIQFNVDEDRHLLEEIGFEVTVLDLKEYFGKNDQLRDFCQNYHSFCIIGGNVFVLRSAMKYSGFDLFLKDLTEEDDNLLIGYSAGASVFSNRIDVLNMVDDKIDFYQKGIITDGLGFIDYVFVPHYKSNYHKVHLIDSTIEKCKREKIPYKALQDGDYILEDIPKIKKK